MTFVQHIGAPEGIAYSNMLSKAGLTQHLKGALCNISIAMDFSDAVTSVPIMSVKSRLLILL